MILKKLKYCLILTAAVAGNFYCLSAQVDSAAKTSLAEAEIARLRTTWSESANPASLTFFDFEKRMATAYIYNQASTGDYHLFQQGNSNNQTGFFTEGLINLGKWKFYGNFDYFSESEKNTRWVDVMEPYNDNPYTLGDSVGGNYSKEYFNMEGKGAYQLSSCFTFGFDVNYVAGVGAKRKDPRPENTLSKFSIVPGVVLDFGKIRLGAGFRYETGKEDIDITTVTTEKFALFHYKGLGTFSTTQEDDHQSFESEQLGGNFQVNFEGGSFQNLTELKWDKKSTDIKRGVSFPLQVVLLEKYDAEISSIFFFNPNEKNIRRLKVFYHNKRVYGQEPVVEPKLEEVNYQWSTVAKYTLYWDKSNDFGLDYSWVNLATAGNINWGVSLGGKLSPSEVTYYFVPEFSKQKLNLFQLDARVKKGLIFKSWEALLEGGGSYRSGFDCSLELPADPSLLPTINTAFVNHDFEYYQTGLWQLGASLKLGKNISVYRTPLQLFFETGYQMLISGLDGNPDLKIAEFKLGMNF